MGLIWGVVITNTLRVLIAQSIARYMKILSVRKLIANIWRAIVANAAMITGLIYFMKIEFQIFEGLLLVELILDTLVGGLIYAVTIVSLWLLSSKAEGPEKSILSVLTNDRVGGETA